MKIAIVEDDQAIAEMYRLKFAGDGYTVQVASNGDEGLALVEAMRPDIVLLDMMMPIMTGDEMLAKMRATEWGKDIKVIILTNMGEQEAPALLKKLNVSSFIVKADMTPRQVADRIRETLAS